MSREAREVLADWLMVIGAAALLVALFLPWSHQLSRGFAAAFAPSGGLAGVPRDPTAWQVFSTVDVLLAALAAGVFGLAMFGPRRPRLAALVLTGLALCFVVHALAVPPTNGAGAVTPPAAVPAGGASTSAAEATSLPVDRPSSGAGGTVALVALLVCAGGLALSLTAD